MEYTGIIFCEFERIFFFNWTPFGEFREENWVANSIIY